MKRLLLLRHAKSSWDDPGLPDRERPLGPRGIRDVPRIGRYLDSHGLRPDRVWCSPAERARATALGVVAQFESAPPVEFVDALYAEDVHAIHRRVSACEDTVACLMLVGHFPQLQLLLEEMTGQAFAYRKFPTCAVAVLDFAVQSWADVLEREGRFEHFVRPRDLKN